MATQVWQYESATLTSNTGVGPKLAVGTVVWRAARPVMTVVAKLTLDFASKGKEMTLGPQRPLRDDLAHTLRGAWRRELAYPSDFAWQKPACDLLLYGHAMAEGLTTQLDAQVTVDQWQRKLALRCPEPLGRIPLTARYLRRDGHADPVCALRRDFNLPDGLLPSEVDLTAGQSAPVLQQIPHLRPGAQLSLRGFRGGEAEQVMRLPSYAPCASIIFSRRGPVRLRFVCDTLWLDVDAQQAVVVWRAVVATGGQEAERILLALAPAQTDAAASLGSTRVQHVSAASTCHADAFANQASEPNDLSYAALAGAPSSIPEEGSLSAYAELRNAIERGAEPGPLLARFGLSPDRWIRVDRYWRQRAEHDLKIAREITRLIAMQRLASKVA